MYMIHAGIKRKRKKNKTYKLHYYMVYCTCDTTFIAFTVYLQVYAL